MKAILAYKLFYLVLEILLIENELKLLVDFLFYCHFEILNSQFIYYSMLHLRFCRFGSVFGSLQINLHNSQTTRYLFLFFFLKGTKMFQNFKDFSPKIISKPCGKFFKDKNKNKAISHVVNNFKKQKKNSKLKTK